MTTRAQGEVRIGTYLREPLTVGEPDVPGPIAVYPVFGFAPQQEYISMSRAQALGLTVKEQPGSGSVRDVIVSNPTDHAVLIHEGEELIQLSVLTNRPDRTERPAAARPQNMRTRINRPSRRHP